MPAFNPKRLAITASLNRTQIHEVAGHPLFQFCRDLQDNRAPYYGLWWPTKPELSNLSLWTCLEAKYSLVGRTGSGFDIDFTDASEHLIDIQNGQWIPIGSRGGLSFPVTHATSSGFLAISFQ